MNIFYRLISDQKSLFLHHNQPLVMLKSIVIFINNEAFICGNNSWLLDDFYCSIKRRKNMIHKNPLIFLYDNKIYFYSKKKNIYMHPINMIYNIVNFLKRYKNSIVHLFLFCISYFALVTSVSLHIAIYLRTSKHIYMKYCCKNKLKNGILFS